MIVRSEQIAYFSQAARRKFVAETMFQMRSFAPEAGLNISDDVLQNFVVQSLEKAESYGFTLIGTLRFYIELSFIFGLGFDTDPQFPWAATTLRDTSITDEIWRADALHDAVEKYIGEVSGKDCENLRNALLATKRVAQQEINWQKELSEQRLTELAEWIFPQKIQALDQNSQHEIYRRAQESAGENGIRNHYGVVLCYFLNLFCGHQCTIDPLFPWLSQSFSDTPKNLNDRVRQIAQVAFTNLDSSILHWQTGACLSGGGSKIPLRPSKRNHDLRPFDQVITTVVTDNLSPLFEPDKWNDEGFIQPTSNSYAYVLDKRVEQISEISATPPKITGMQPGQAAGKVLTSLAIESLREAFIEDGSPDKLIPALRCIADRDAMLPPPAKSGYYLMALVATSRDGYDLSTKAFYLADFHCYRQDSDGGWSHKPGHTPVLRSDADEQIISNPETAARRKNLGTIYIPTIGETPLILDYDIFCGYFYVKKSDL